jgi:autotransporter-associated beta strand protein
VNDALGTNAAGTVIASGATLDLQNVTYSTTEAITNNGGTLSTSTGTSSYAGTMTLGADATIDVDGTQLTISTAIGDGSNGYAITKEGTGTLVLSATNTFSGDLTISNGTVTMTGTLNDFVDVINSGTYDVDATDTIQSLSGSGNVELASITLTTGDAGDDEISGVISGTGNLTKAGSGTLTLSANNTYTGATTINEGVLSITHNNALGYYRRCYHRGFWCGLTCK